MAEPSWLLLEREDPEHALPEALRAEDPAGAVDCGWVEQMRPFLRAFSHPGATALDPFAGFGTTLVACALEGRQGLGIDVEAKRVELARRRLASPAYAALTPQRIVEGNARAMRLPAASVDLCLTNIPYFGSRWPGQAAPDAQLYAANDYAGYLDGLDEVFQRVREALAEGGHVVAMAQNVLLPGGTFLPLAWDIARVLARRLTLCEERILLYQRPLPDDPDPRRTNRAHEYALIACRRALGVDLGEAAELLTALAGRNINFVVIGSLARQWLSTEPLMQPPHDVDILVPGECNSLNHLVQSLMEWGFAVHSWDEPVRAPLDPYRLLGRYYLRAVRVNKRGGRLVLDATYESPALLPFEEVWQRRTLFGPIAVASSDDLDRFQQLRRLSDAPLSLNLIR
jgi:SAM-dependent methyltransferase